MLAKRFRLQIFGKNIGKKYSQSRVRLTNVILLILFLQWTFLYAHTYFQRSFFREKKRRGFFSSLKKVYSLRTFEHNKLCSTIFGFRFLQLVLSSQLAEISPICHRINFGMEKNWILNLKWTPSRKLSGWCPFPKTNSINSTMLTK